MSLATIQRVAALLLLLTLFGLLVFSVGMKSPTADEQNHMARGLAYLQTGDLRLSQEHPPGVNAWEAWPLLLDPDVRLPLESPTWANAEWYGFADQLLWRVNDRPQAMVFCTRVPVMWLTLILGALVYRWTRTLAGTWGGLIALVLLVFDPNVLAHGRLTTTDMGITCLTVAAMWSLWRAIMEPDWRQWIWAGLAFGAVQLSKFSALILGPVTLLVIALAWVRQWRTSESFPARELGRWGWRLLLLFGVGGATIWAGYRFAWGPIARLGGLAGPAPAYWSGIVAVLRRTGGGSPAFLMGHYSREGWWVYFPVAFALKTPLPTLISLVLALGLWIGDHVARRRRLVPIDRALQGSLLRPGRWASRSARERALAHGDCSACLLLPVVGFGAMALAGSFNIGYRHILPVLPFLYIWAGWQLAEWATGPRFKGAVSALFPPVGKRTRGRPAGMVLVPIAAAALLLWLIAGTVLICPDYLAYFNAIAGGPDGGYRFLVDSNLDWGQDLPGLKRYAVAHGLERIYLSWFGAAHPEAYGLDFHPLPGFWRFGGDPAAYGFNPDAPAPGIYAISVTNLQGVPFADHDLYAWFRDRTPVARIGHSIFVYHVQERQTDDTAVVLGVPLSQLVDQERGLLADGATVRRYDPATGMIVPLALDADRVWFVAPDLAEGAKEVRKEPGYVVFQMASGQMPARDVDARFGSFVRMLDHRIEERSPVRDPALTLIVHWSVEQLPHRAVVSFAHLLDADGRYVEGWDGLTAPATCWQVGDLIEQQYRIPLPEGLSPGSYQIEIGWYDADTLERWPCFVSEQPVGDRFLIEGLEIER